ncbi:hypothetical protein KGY79_13460 [Candidatus Bipolaricaulota bacterium]|nr:hypothetical protein [Candidatus Bipolaricaulota bacterium]
MTNPGYNFENELLNALRDNFPNTFSYRFKQSKMSSQPFDLLFLSQPKATVIECKSKDIRGRKTLKLEQLFREGQLEGEINRAERYRLRGMLFLELRAGRGRTKRCYYDYLYNVSGTTINLANPSMVEVEREGSEYLIEDEFWEV